MKTLLFTAILALGLTSSLFAQSEFTWMYSVGFPTGNLNTFMSKTSWRGITADYRYRYSANMAIGITTGWQTFYEERSSATYTIENTSLTGKQFRYSNHAPILATFTYYKKSDTPVKPFATLGIGTMYSRRNTDMNIYTNEQEAWNFALQPEIGVAFHYNELAGFVVSAKYLHGFQAGNELKEAQTFFTLNVGFTFF